VLCAYLGQLARLRDNLGSKVAVIIDERDQAALDDQESDGDKQTPGQISVEHVNVTKRVGNHVKNNRQQAVHLMSQVRLRTVDNYQGEEGRVSSLFLLLVSLHSNF